MHQFIYQSIPMNKFIFLCISFTFIFASCKYGGDQELRNISALVDETEVIINKYDNSVHNALDSSKYEYIKTVSKATIDSSNLKINDLKNLVVSPPTEELRILAIAYIKSLQKIISAQEVYATITDTTSIDIAKDMDSNFREAVEHAKKMRDTYMTQLNTFTN